jgi:hypothetical protein
VPISPASVSVGSGSATVSGNGQIITTNASSISIDNCFTSLYENYKVIWTSRIQSGVPARFQVNMLKSTDGTVSGDTAAVFTKNTWGTGGNELGGNQTTYQVGIAERYTNTLTMDVMFPLNNSNDCTLHTHTITNTYMGIGGAYITKTTNYRGIRLSFDTGATFSGTVRIYGYANGA